MNLVRKYKISKLLNIPLTKEENNIIQFITLWLTDLSPYQHPTYYNSIFFINKYNQVVLQFLDNQEENRHIIYVRGKDFWDTLYVHKGYNLNDNVIKELLYCIIKEKFKKRSNFVNTAEVIHTIRFTNIEEYLSQIGIEFKNELIEYYGKDN